MSSERVAVVGAGISGLTLAYYLTTRGKSVTVFESADATGGKIKTIHKNGFELDLGPVSCAETLPLATLIKDLGLEHQVLSAAAAVSKRYIYSQGHIHGIEPSPLKLLMHPMLSWNGRVGLVNDLFIKPKAEQTYGDETVATFVRRHFGEEAHQKLFNPVLNGIYAGDSEALSIISTLPLVKTLAGKYGSVVKGLGKEKNKANTPRKIISMRGGFSQLIEALQNKIGTNLRLASPVKKMTTHNGRVSLVINEGGVEKEYQFNKVYLTLPSHACAALIDTMDSSLAKAISEITYPKVNQIYCEVETTKVFDGFGFLIPANERLSLLGAICISNVFPDKAPAGKKLFALFCGGQRPYAFQPKVEDAIQEFHSILHPSLINVMHVQEWSQAIPQFYVGHQKILQSLKDFEAAHPAITFAGNYVSGVSLGDCVAYAATIG